MKKNIIKSALAIVAVAAVGFGSYKTYNAYSTQQPDANLLLTENVEALSQGDAALSIPPWFKWIPELLKWCGYIGDAYACFDLLNSCNPHHNEWVTITTNPNAYKYVDGQRVNYKKVTQECQSIQGQGKDTCTHLGDVRYLEC